MANSSPEGIELGKGSRLVSLDLSINDNKILEIKKQEVIILVNPLHITLESSGYGEFSNTYKLTQKGIEYLKSKL